MGGNRTHSNGQGVTEFTLVLDGQPMQVRYDPHAYPSAGYGRWEFRSPHVPLRRIPVSATGYRSYFAPIWEVEQAPDLAAYAHLLAQALVQASTGTVEDDAEEEVGQMDLF